MLGPRLSSSDSIIRTHAGALQASICMFPKTRCNSTKMLKIKISPHCGHAFRQPAAAPTDFAWRLEQSARQAVGPVVYTPAYMAAAPLASLFQCEGKHDQHCVGKRWRFSRSCQTLKRSFHSTRAESNRANYVLQRASSCCYLVTWKGLKPWGICSWTAEHLRWMLAPPTLPHFLLGFHHL